MASTIYYGKSVTASGEQVKEVIVQGLDSTVTQESDFLASGDILVVYFASKNTHSTPYMKLYNGDMEHEIAASGDNGNQIRIQSSVVDLDGIWSNGEVCSFVYMEVDNAFYWYLTSSTLAEQDVYGKVKLVTSIDEEFDANAAITASAVVNLIEGQEPDSLTYTPKSSQDIWLGTLELRDSEESILSSINLYAPEIIDPETFRAYTDEIINNGPKKEEGEEETEANIGYGHPYITRIVPGRLSFANLLDPEVPIRGLTIINDNNEEFVAYELTNAQGNASVNSQRNLILNPADNFIIALNGDTEVNGKGLFNDSLRIKLDSTTDAELINKINRLGWSSCLK